MTPNLHEDDGGSAPSTSPPTAGGLVAGLLRGLELLLMPRQPLQPPVFEEAQQAHIEGQQQVSPRDRVLARHAAAGDHPASSGWLNGNVPASSQGSSDEGELLFREAATD